MNSEADLIFDGTGLLCVTLLLRPGVVPYDRPHLPQPGQAPGVRAEAHRRRLLHPPGRALAPLRQDSETARDR